MTGTVDPAGSERLTWVDAARGACVLAVVSFHVWRWHVSLVGDGVGGSPAAAWSAVNGFLGSFRMPLLLMLSGMLASRAVSRGPADASVLRRAATNYYLYLVWLVVYALFFLALGAGPYPHRIEGASQLLQQVALPRTTLWYVFALAVYLPLFAALRRAPCVLVLTGFLALSVVSRVWWDEGGLLVKVPQLAVFFGIGVYGANRLRSLIGGLSWASTLVVLVAMAAVATFALQTPPVVDALLFVVRGAAVGLLGFLVVAVLVRFQPLSRAGSFLGRRTLPVYVLHAPLVVLLLVATEHGAAGPVRRVLAQPVGALLYPAVVTILVVSLALGIDRVLRAAGGGFLFQPGHWLGRLTDRAASALFDLSRATSAPSGPAAALPDLAAGVARDEPHD